MRQRGNAVQTRQRHRFKFDKFNNLYSSLHFNTGIFFINLIKSNELGIIMRDAGASGRHSHAAHGNEELFVLFNKIM